MARDVGIARCDEMGVEKLSCGMAGDVSRKGGSTNSSAGGSCGPQAMVLTCMVWDAW